MKLPDNVIKLGKILPVIIGILTAIWWFGKLPFHNEVEQITRSYIQKPEFTQRVTNITRTYIEGAEFQRIHTSLFLNHITSAEFDKKLDQFINDNAENKVSFRKILSIKMQVVEGLVASEMAELYVKDKKRLINVLRLLSKEYPDSQLWETD